MKLREKTEKATVMLEIFNIISAQSAAATLQWSMSGAKVVYSAAVSVLTRINVDSSTPDDKLTTTSFLLPCNVISFSFESHVGISVVWQQTSLTSVSLIVPLLLRASSTADCCDCCVCLLREYLYFSAWWKEEGFRNFVQSQRGAETVSEQTNTYTENTLSCRQTSSLSFSFWQRRAISALIRMIVFF